MGYVELAPPIKVTDENREHIKKVAAMIRESGGVMAGEVLFVVIMTPVVFVGGWWCGWNHRNIWNFHKWTMREDE